ncbi:MAG: hypothetical protein CM15mP130_3020 [Verrucomicrobiota bacterium]|nr:MAG: hypothetical protein CM15mP130_3020 [Verrucomicrobiota bacterium]
MGFTVTIDIVLLFFPPSQDVKRSQYETTPLFETVSSSSSRPCKPLGRTRIVPMMLNPSRHAGMGVGRFKKIIQKPAHCEIMLLMDPKCFQQIRRPIFGIERGIHFGVPELFARTPFTLPLLYDDEHHPRVF